jgi:hypothetical protein
MCRAQQTVEAGTYGSKPEAAAWGRERNPEWAWLIDAALRGRLSRGTIGFDDEVTRTVAIAFIRHVADQISRTS